MRGCSGGGLGPQEAGAPQSPPLEWPSCPSPGGAARGEPPAAARPLARLWFGALRGARPPTRPPTRPVHPGRAGTGTRHQAPGDTAQTSPELRGTSRFPRGSSCRTSPPWADRSARQALPATPRQEGPAQQTPGQEESKPRECSCGVPSPDAAFTIRVCGRAESREGEGQALSRTPDTELTPELELQPRAFGPAEPRVRCSYKVPGGGGSGGEGLGDTAEETAAKRFTTTNDWLRLQPAGTRSRLTEPAPPPFPGDEPESRQPPHQDSPTGGPGPGRRRSQRLPPPTHGGGRGPGLGSARGPQRQRPLGAATLGPPAHRLSGGLVTRCTLRQVPAGVYGGTVPAERRGREGSRVG